MPIAFSVHSTPVIVRVHAHEAIVNEDTFLRVQALRTQSKPQKRRNQRRVYLRSRLLRCAQCNDDTVCRPSTSRHGRTTYWYQCRRRRSPVCHAPAIRAEALEEATIKALIEAISNAPAIDAALTKHSSRESLLGRLASRQVELEGLQRRVGALESSAPVAINRDDVTKAIAKIQSQLAELLAHNERGTILRDAVHKLIAGVEVEFGARSARLKCRIPAIEHRGYRKVNVAGA